MLCHPICKLSMKKKGDITDTYKRLLLSTHSGLSVEIFKRISTAFAGVSHKGTSLSYMSTLNSLENLILRQSFKATNYGLVQAQRA